MGGRLGKQAFFNPNVQARKKHGFCWCAPPCSRGLIPRSTSNSRAINMKYVSVKMMFYLSNFSEFHCSFRELELSIGFICEYYIRTFIL